MPLRSKKEKKKKSRRSSLLSRSWLYSLDLGFGIIEGIVGENMEYLGIDVSCAVGSLRHGNFPDKDCLLPLISKLLGYAIVAASTTVKLPQILKILKHRSVRGLSMMSFELEVVGYTIALAYCLHKGLPFSAYGELLFLLIQALVLVAIIYYFSQPVGTKTWIGALLYCAVAPTILAGQINPLLFEALHLSMQFSSLPGFHKYGKTFLTKVQGSSAS